MFSSRSVPWIALILLCVLLWVCIAGPTGATQPLIASPLRLSTRTVDLNDERYVLTEGPSADHTQRNGANPGVATEGLYLVAFPRSLKKRVSAENFLASLLRPAEVRRFPNRKKVAERIPHETHDVHLVHLSAEELDSLRKANSEHVRVVKLESGDRTHLRLGSFDENVRKVGTRRRREGTNLPSQTTTVLSLGVHLWNAPQTEANVEEVRAWVEAQLRAVSPAGAMIDYSFQDPYEMIHVGLPAHENIRWQSILDIFTDAFPASFPHLEVRWVRPIFRKALRNLVANAMLQSGEADRSYLAMPLWSAGITGGGQIVHVTDTGIDWKNCFFNDASQIVTPDTPLPSHRKVSYYQRISDVCGVPNCPCRRRSRRDKSYSGDDHDRTSGHGTHVAGSCCGKTTSSDSRIVKYNGVAPDARLDFCDIQNDDCGGLLLPKTDSKLLSDVFEAPYARGAKISSNSWGCDAASVFRCEFDCECVYLETKQPVTNSECEASFGRRCCELCNYYDSEEILLDRFMYDHDDALLVFAAGNDGQIAEYGTIGAPATARNVLSVGASMTSQANFAAGAEKIDIERSLLQAQEMTQGACCGSQDECCAASEPSVQMVCCPPFQEAYFSHYAEVFNENGLADFSAAGNVSYGWTKPDVVAPGFYVISAHARGNTPFDPKHDLPYCEPGEPNGQNDAALYSNLGTSMSAPLMAGAAALVRDYFSQGFGGPNVTSNPSGAMVKASLMHASRRLSGKTIKGSTILPIENLDHMSILSCVQGYGLPVLPNALPHPSYSPPGLMSTFFDRVRIAEDEKHVYCFEKNASDPDVEFRVTLAWMDYPGPELASRDLVIDLDLYLCVKDGDCFVGNGNHEGGDHANANEQVRVPPGTIDKGDEFAFAVTARLVDHGDFAQYAIVMSGGSYRRTPAEGCTIRDDPFASNTPYVLIVAISVPLTIALCCIGGIVIGLLIYFVVLRKKCTRNKGDSRLLPGGPEPQARPLGKGRRLGTK